MKTVNDFINFKCYNTKKGDCNGIPMGGTVLHEEFWQINDFFLNLHQLQTGEKLR